MYITCPIDRKYIIFCTQFSAQKPGNHILGHWNFEMFKGSTLPDPSRRRGAVKPSFWYSRLLFQTRRLLQFLLKPLLLGHYFLSTLSSILQINQTQLVTFNFHKNLFTSSTGPEMRPPFLCGHPSPTNAVPSFLSYFKTQSIGPAPGSNLRHSVLLSNATVYVALC